MSKDVRRDRSEETYQKRQYQSSKAETGSFQERLARVMRMHRGQLVPIKDEVLVDPCTGSSIMIFHHYLTSNVRTRMNEDEAWRTRYFTTFGNITTSTATIISLDLWLVEGFHRIRR